MKTVREFGLVAVAAALAVGAVFGFGSVAAAQADNATYSAYVATTTVPVPPASSYAGSAGGDGWALAINPDAVYNVFHHQQTLQVACHLQSDASACWTPRTVTDGDGNNFASSGQPGLYSDPATGQLFVFATRASDSSAGVVCIDTVAAATNPDPFCGYTVLAPAGEAPLDGSGISGTSNPVLIGTSWYAFNTVTGPSTGSRNHLLCFDTSTKAACASQPFDVVGALSLSDAGGFPVPSIAAIGSQVVVPYIDSSDSSQHLACFASTTGAGCAGSWPVAISSYINQGGAAFPLLSSTGVINGFCLPTSANPCFGQDGSSIATPAGMTGAIGGTSQWNGPALTVGPRVYVPNGNANSVACYDYATGAGCTNFPKAIQNLELLYTVNADPQRPSCIWVNADGGADQIQNFDAYSAGACGEGQVRVFASSLVSPLPQCTPQSYQSLQILDPAPGAYTGATVSFVDSDSNPIPNAPSRPVNAQGVVDLSGLDLGAGIGLPQFLIQFADQSSQAASVKVQLNWTALDDVACGASAPITPTPTPTPTETTTPTTTATAVATTSSGLANTGATVTPALTIGAVLAGFGVLLLGTFAIVRRHRSAASKK